MDEDGVHRDVRGGQDYPAQVAGFFKMANPTPKHLPHLPSLLAETHEFGAGCLDECRCSAPISAPTPLSPGSAKFPEEQVTGQNAIASRNAPIKVGRRGGRSDAAPSAMVPLST